MYNSLIFIFSSFNQIKQIKRLAPDEFEGTTDYQSPFIKQKQQKQQTPSPPPTTSQSPQEAAGQQQHQQQRGRKKEKLANLKRSFLSKFLK